MTFVKDVNYLVELSRSGDWLKVLPLQPSSMSLPDFISPTPENLSVSLEYLSSS